MSTILGRGLRRVCPRCGEGPLFSRWITMHDRCAVCGLQYLRNPGDLWIWIIITDRIPILLGIAILYFGFGPRNWTATLGFFALMAIPLLATMPHRQGLALALDYLVRVHMPDPSDDVHSDDP